MIDNKINEGGLKANKNTADKIVKYALLIAIALFLITGFYKIIHSTTDSEFVGEWCYCTIGNSNSETGRNCVVSIKKVENTSESYNFNMSYIFTLNETFTKQDNNTLVSVGTSGMTLKYVDSTNHILLLSKDGSAMEFSKLQ